MGKTRCHCESSLCDHEGMCEREIQGYVRMEYVVECCSNCAANMGKTGGAQYLHLYPDTEQAEPVVHDCDPSSEVCWC